MIATIHSKQLIFVALCLCAAGCKSRPVLPIFPIFGERNDSCSDCQLSVVSEPVASDLVRVDSETSKVSKPTGILVNARNFLSSKKTPPSTSSVQKDQSIADGNAARQKSQGEQESGKRPVIEESKARKDSVLSTIQKEVESSQQSQPGKSSRRTNATEKEVSGEISSSKLTSIEKFDLGVKEDKLKSQVPDSNVPEDRLATAPKKLNENETPLSEPSKANEAKYPVADLPNLSDQIGLSNSFPSTAPETAMQAPTQISPSANSPLEAYVSRNPTQVLARPQNGGAETQPKTLPDGFRVVDSPGETMSSSRQDWNSERDPYYNNHSARLDSANQDHPLVLDLRVKDWPAEPKMEPRALQIQQELKTHRQITRNVAPGIYHQQFANGNHPNQPPAQSTGPMRNASYRNGFSNHFDSSQVADERSNWSASNDQDKESSLILNAIPKSENVALAPVVEVTASQTRTPQNKHKNTLPDLPERSPMPLLEEDGPIRDLPPINSENRYTNRPEDRGLPQIDR